MEYTIVSSYDLPYLEDLVNEHLEDGWECQGGIAVMFASKGMNEREFFQAMIKKK